MTSYTYTGDGSQYLEGVPMRDLDEDDWAALDEDHQIVVQLSPLYLSTDEAAAQARAEKRAARRQEAAATTEAPAEAPPEAPPADGGTT